MAGGSPAGRAGAVGRNFVSDLVAFEDVLQRADLHVEAFHRAQEREDFVLPITVAMNEPLALNNFADGFEFEVAAWQDRRRACL